MPKFRKKPVIIEAIQFTGDNVSDCLEFAGLNIETTTEKALIISTLEGRMICSIGDYIIKGVKGEFYPCKPDIFEQTYEKVEND